MNKAYTLLELLITFAITAVLLGLAYPLYIQHTVKTHRSDGQLSLVKLSSSLENYYLAHNTYKGATFNNLDFAEKSPQGFYKLQIQLEQDDQSYIIKAVPQGFQAKHDKACGTLLLTTDGRRSYQGDDMKASCW